jgi:hypothetical protein
VTSDDDSVDQGELPDDDDDDVSIQLEPEPDDFPIDGRDHPVDNNPPINSESLDPLDPANQENEGVPHQDIINDEAPHHKRRNEGVPRQTHGSRGAPKTFQSPSGRNRAGLRMHPRFIQIFRLYQRRLLHENGSSFPLLHCKHQVG